MPDDDDKRRLQWPDSGFDEDGSVRKSAVETARRRPTPRMPPSWFPPSAEILASADSAYNQCADYLESYAGVCRNELNWLKPEMLKIVRDYWADKKFDEQPTFAAIKKELRVIGQSVKRVEQDIDKLSPITRMQLDSKLQRHTEGAPSVKRLGDLRNLLRDFGTVINRSESGIEAVKTGVTAVSNCSAALQAVWKKAAGKRRFGPEFVMRICLAMDPELTAEQIAWRGKQAAQSLSGKK